MIQKKKNNNKETEALNDVLEHINFPHIDRIFHVKAAEYNFFSSAHRTFSRIDHILDYKSSLDKIRKIEIILSIFFRAMRLENKYSKKNFENTETWELNNTYSTVQLLSRV